MIDCNYSMFTLLIFLCGILGYTTASLGVELANKIWDWREKKQLKKEKQQ